MAEYLIQSETLDDIAEAINARTGGASSMTPAEMAAAIESMETGGLDVARLVPGTYTGGCVVDADGRISSEAMSYGITFPLTKPFAVSEGDKISVAMMNTIRTYHEWRFYSDGVLVQTAQTANYNSPYVTGITAAFTGEIDAVGLRHNPTGSVSNLKFSFFINGKPVLA